MLRFLKTYWPTLIVIAVIIYATWIPKPIPYEDLPGIPHIDKLIHAIMFGGLLAAVMFDYHRCSPRRNRLTSGAILVFAAGCSVFGVVDEVVQGLLAIGRPSDFLDIIADWVGIAIAALTAPPVINAIFKDRNRS